jgi:hypothetical protein
MGDYGALVITGTCTLPTTQPCRETGYVFGTIISQGIWDVDSYWSTIEGTWAYPLSGYFTALAGFRWKSWQLSYTSFDNEGSPHAPTDTGDATYNGYIPFVGLLATYQGLNLGVIGFPTTFGDVKQFEQWLGPAFNVRATGQLGGGYFVEIFGDYAMPMPGSLVSGQEVDLSLFGKVSFLETGGATTHRWSVGTEQEWDFQLSRKLFIVGAKATWSFNLANLLPI